MVWLWGAGQSALSYLYVFMDCKPKNQNKCCDSMLKITYHVHLMHLISQFGAVSGISNS